ncbi:MAG TPA: hypothetical protein DEQ27_00335 [Prevotella sp.]|nr:hypothetical protein [Prevotella sp.]
MTRAIFYTIILSLFFLNVNDIHASVGINNTDRALDSVEVSLLTCSPHDEIYSLYGHTAIRFQDKKQGLDLAVNYGVFSFKKPYFVLRFVFGLTDYEMGIQNFEDFCMEYRYYGAKVTEQVLNLTPEEKLAVYETLQKNSLPENRIYRYNYFYNNCTTKARDVLLGNIRGKVIFNNKVDDSMSFRKLIHQYNGDHPWARFGNDLLLGVKADAKTTRSEQEFLPANLMTDFSHAVIVRGKTSVPLVKKTDTVVDETVQGEGNTGFCPTPTMCFVILLVVSLAVSIVERMTGKLFWGFDAIVGSLCGIAGLILLAMVFSMHPTVSLNLQILILNPLFLYGAYSLLRNRKDMKRYKKTWNILAAFVVAACFCAIFQQFAEGMIILALSLLLRWQAIFWQPNGSEDMLHKGKRIKQ